MVQRGPEIAIDLACSLLEEVNHNVHNTVRASDLNPIHRLRDNAVVVKYFGGAHVPIRSEHDMSEPARWQKRPQLMSQHTSQCTAR